MNSHLILNSHFVALYSDLTAAMADVCLKFVSAFVNRRRIEVGEAPILALLLV